MNTQTVLAALESVMDAIEDNYDLSDSDVTDILGTFIEALVREVKDEKEATVLKDLLAILDS